MYENSPRSINIMLDDGAYPPTRGHKADAGYDLRTRERVTVSVGNPAVIDTGVHFEIPEGFVGFLKSKSGLNVKNGINGEGVIDAGYTGSIVVKLYQNEGAAPVTFEPGDKIIQIVLLPIYTPELKIVSEFAQTERSDNGFGSTGR